MPKDTPILFTGEMVRAILSGRKTQTRRIVKLTDSGRIKKPGSPKNWHPDDPDAVQACPYGLAGEGRLWVRETFAFAMHSTDYETGGEYCVFRWDKDVHGPYDPKYLNLDPRGASNAAALFYKADGEDELPSEFSMPDGNEIGWTPSIHMPKWACRLWLELTEVRVERLQDCSEEDAIAEGAESFEGECTLREKRLAKAQLQYAALWESINGAGSWARNPFVWVLTFKRVTS